jgi:exopolyphosphatase / guanosine-5'-triphosphate,3'-diphosphate pyrophosphatase
MRCVSRFAAIDVGSNGIRCVVVEAAEDGKPRIVENTRQSVRLGSHVFHTGRIGVEATQRASDAFRVFRRLIDSLEVGQVRAVATSAVREARDAPALIERIAQESGIRIQVIDGAEEAHLVRRAVASRLDLSHGRTTMVDVGGGSVEVVLLADGDVVRSESFELGAIRLLQALPASGDHDDVFALLQEYVSAVRARVLTAIGQAPVDLYAATGGSIETLADLAGEPAPSPPSLDGGARMLRLPKLRTQVVELASRSFHERVRELGLREDRADVILPAALVYLKMGEVFGVDRVYVPGVGLKDGLVLDMIDDIQRRGTIELRRREVRSAALGLGHRYAIDQPHAEKVADLALSLYDQLAALHGLPDEARTLLEAAALLHDVGIYVSASKHHKHSYYLISQSDIVGLDARQREIVANVARYHRRRHPTRRHAPWEALSDPDKEMVRRLSAILRVADVLDREHRQVVRSVRVVERKGRLRLEVEAEGDLLLERWASSTKFALFAEVFGIEITLEE